MSQDGGLRTSDRMRWEGLLSFAGYCIPATVRRDLIVLLSHSAAQYAVWAIMIPSFNIRKPRHGNSWEICQRHTALCLPCSQVCARDGRPPGVLPTRPQPQGSRGDQNPEHAGAPVLPNKQVKSSAPRATQTWHRGPSTRKPVLFLEHDHVSKVEAPLLTLSPPQGITITPAGGPAVTCYVTAPSHVPEPPFLSGKEQVTEDAINRFQDIIMF